MPDTNQEWVEMTHPDLGPDSTDPDGNPARVLRQAYEETWKDKGWKLVSSTNKATTSTAKSTSTGGK